MTALFALFAVLVIAGLEYWLWRRLVGDTTAPGGWPRRAGTVIAVALPLCMIAATLGGRVFAFPVVRVVAWPGYLWLAMVVYLGLGLLVGEIVRPIAVRLSRRRSNVPAPVSPEPCLVAADAPADPPAEPVAPGVAGAVDAADPARRLFIARSIALVAGAAATATVGYGVRTALGPVRVKQLTIPLAKLSPSADGFRIAVVSDIHAGPILGRAHTQRVVETINRTRPDLVAIVGDLVDGNVDQLGGAIEPLSGLRSRHGSFFVTGNHEYFSGADQWVDFVRGLGIRPLENQRVELGGFDLAGVNDLSGEDSDQGPDFATALGDRDRSRAVVLLAHQPRQVYEAARYQVDLQLSGHTHGGQMWPVNFLAGLQNPTVAGLDTIDGTRLYVTRGVGAWGPPVRVGAPPDITVVTLASPRA